MIFRYICDNCIKTSAGKPVTELSVDEYRHWVGELSVQHSHGVGARPQFSCEKCNASLRRLVGMEAAYVRGYGILDKKGVKNDMNLHTMTSGADPYKEHRKSGDASELVSKLRRNKRHVPKTKNVFIG